MGEIDEGLIYMETDDQIMPRRQEKHYLVYNLNILNLNIPPSHDGRNLKINPNQFIELLNNLSLRLIIKRFQGLS